MIFFKFIIPVRSDRCDYLPRGQKKKLATPLKKVNLLYYFVNKVIPSLMWKRRRRVYTEQYTCTAIHLHKDFTTLTALLFANSVKTLEPTWRIVIVTKLRAGRSEVRIPAGMRNFFLLPNVRAGCAVRPTFYSICTGSLYG